MNERIVIGVKCNPGEELWVEEFFELFKTPWEFHDSAQTYAVVVSTHQETDDIRTTLLVLFSNSESGGAPGAMDDAGVRCLDYEGRRVPIYGALRSVGSSGPLAYIGGTVNVAVCEQRCGLATVVVAGYNLFDEVRFLLSVGQPAANALIPTLDIHIEMLRRWIVDTGIPVVEIPAIPAGYESIACLTHDVDFIRIKDYQFTASMLGFLYRASIGSLWKLVQKRMVWRDCLTNLKAALSLPLVLCGLRRDFWLEDFDRFLDLERGLKATYFFIPFKGRPGEHVARPDGRRAARYDVRDEWLLLRRLAAAGQEIGVHAIDAWHDVRKGHEERRSLAEATGEWAPGVRVHWLCFDADSPRVLEAAGFQYDSTFGYNDAVGYRAGTTQAFRPAGVAAFLELPLNIQDNALFANRRMGLGERGAWRLCETLRRNAVRYGGVLTILWHTRSLAPERLWGRFYARLLRKLQTQKIWFATSKEAAMWFRKRRAVTFKYAEVFGQEVQLAMNGGFESGGTPGLTLRVHMPGSWRRKGGGDGPPTVDIPWAGGPATHAVRCPEECVESSAA